MGVCGVSAQAHEAKSSIDQASSAPAMRASHTEQGTNPESHEESNDTALILYQLATEQMPIRTSIKRSNQATCETNNINSTKKQRLGKPVSNISCHSAEEANNNLRQQHAIFVVSEAVSSQESNPSAQPKASTASSQESNPSAQPKASTASSQESNPSAQPKASTASSQDSKLAAQPIASTASSQESNPAAQPIASTASSQESNPAAQPIASTASSQESNPAAQPKASTASSQESNPAAQPKASTASSQESNPATKPKASTASSQESNPAAQPIASTASSQESNPADQPKASTASSQESNPAAQPIASTASSQESNPADQPKASTASSQESNPAAQPIASTTASKQHCFYTQYVLPRFDDKLQKITPVNDSSPWLSYVNKFILAPRQIPHQMRIHKMLCLYNENSILMCNKTRLPGRLACEAHNKFNLCDIQGCTNLKHLNFNLCTSCSKQFSDRLKAIDLRRLKRIAMQKS